MDMSYATILVFNQNRRLYRESHMKYMVSNTDKPNNTPIYSTRSSLDSFILCNEDEITQQDKENIEPIDFPENQIFPRINFKTLTINSNKKTKMSQTYFGQ